MSVIRLLATGTKAAAATALTSSLISCMPQNNDGRMAGNNTSVMSYNYKQPLQGVGNRFMS